MWCHFPASHASDATSGDHRSDATSSCGYCREAEGSRNCCLQHVGLQRAVEIATGQQELLLAAVRAVDNSRKSRGTLMEQWIQLRKAAEKAVWAQTPPFMEVEDAIGKEKYGNVGLST